MDDGGATGALIDWVTGSVYDRIESHFGKVAALIAGFLTGVALLGLVAAVAWYFLSS